MHCVPLPVLFFEIFCVLNKTSKNIFEYENLIQLTPDKKLALLPSNTEITNLKTIKLDSLIK